jgi:hypothetical protein
MGIGAVIGGIVQGNAAKKAAKAQTAAANRQFDLQERIYDENVERFDPYGEQNTNALAALMFDLGLGEAPTFGGTPLDISEISAPGRYETFSRERMNDSGEGGTVSQGQRWINNDGTPDQTNPLFGGQSGRQGPGTRFQVGGQIFSTREEAEAYANANATGGTLYGGYQASPDNLFRIREGIAGVDASAASRGSLYSGATIQAASDRATDIASLGRDNYLNRLSGLVSTGQASAGQSAAAGQNYATGTSNALANIGNAQAAGAIGQGNAINGAINNLTGLFQYQNLNNGNGNGQNGGMFGDMLFGGNGNWFGI